LALINAKQLEFSALKLNKKESLIQQIGEIGWERSVKRDQEKGKLIAMAKQRDIEVAAKKAHLDSEQTELDHLKAAHADMITNKTETNKQTAMIETNKVCSQQGDLNQLERNLYFHIFSQSTKLHRGCFCSH
jgi:hypothetical protein